jgi:hypothetical protein
MNELESRLLEVCEALEAETAENERLTRELSVRRHALEEAIADSRQPRPVRDDAITIAIQTLELLRSAREAGSVPPMQTLKTHSEVPGETSARAVSATGWPTETLS